MRVTFRETAKIAALILGVYLVIQYIFPLMFPFLIGALLALAAEPMVRFFVGKCRLPRGAASAIGVGMTVIFLTMVVVSLCGLLLRELGRLAGALPGLEQSIRDGMEVLSDRAMSLAQAAPEGIRGVLTRNVSDFFSDGSRFLDNSVSFLLRHASGILTRIPGGALTLVTGLISGFMISGKLPKIREFAAGRLSREWIGSLRRTLSRLKATFFSWFRAQLKLMTVTLTVVLAGLLLLRVPYAPLWAVLIATVDALPVLGVGAVLVPWSVVSFLQGDSGRAFTLLGIYAVTAAARSILEPRLVGRQLGVDPLVTLVALYVGYRLFGFLGILLSPLLAVAAVRIFESAEESTE